MPERRRPDRTLVVPDPLAMGDLCAAFINAHCVFTAEPSPHQPGAWLVGCFADGENAARNLFGALSNGGTLGDHL